MSIYISCNFRRSGNFDKKTSQNGTNVYVSETAGVLAPIRPLQPDEVLVSTTTNTKVRSKYLAFAYGETVVVIVVHFSCFTQRLYTSCVKCVKNVFSGRSGHPEVPGVHGKTSAVGEGVFWGACSLHVPAGGRGRRLLVREYRDRRNGAVIDWQKLLVLVIYV